MTRAILVCFHQYTPFGGEFYAPILDFFLAQMKKYEDEYDHLYLLDSTWNIDSAKIKDLKATIIRTDPSLRYYDTYKEIIPQVKEDLIMLMDDDMVVYKKGKIENTFWVLGQNKWEMGKELGEIGVATIYDTIGEYKTDKLDGKNKFCPYWFAAKKETLMRYLNVDWAPDMPYCETLGHLTESMLADGVIPYEIQEDKSNILFSGAQDGEKSLDTGRYHIRAGSTPSYLLATKKYGDKKTYDDYLKNQPQDELLRHCAWYQYMGGDPGDITFDLGISYGDYYLKYLEKFKEYHGLP